MLAITVMTLLFVPLVGCFQFEVPNYSFSYYFFFELPLILFCVEIIISLNTAYYEAGDI